VKLRAPEPFADDNHVRLARLVLIGHEDTPCDWLYAEGREIIRCGDFAVDALREFPSFKIEAGVIRSAKFRERGALPFEIDEVPTATPGKISPTSPARTRHAMVFHG